MQILKAHLSPRVDRERFIEAWRVDAKLSARPEVEFEFQPGGVMIARIHSTPGALWDESNFKKAFAIALGRIAPGCEIDWL